MNMADAATLIDLIGSGWKTQAVYAAAELRLPDLLADGPHDTATLATATGCPAPPLRRLLRALCSLGVCEALGGDRFALSPVGQLLREGTQPSLRAQALWWGKYLWPVWGQLLGSVRTGVSARRLAGSQTYGHVRDDAQAAAVFHQAMVDLTRLVADEVARAGDFAGARHVVDVGGGHGELLFAVLAAHPGLQGTLFDTPQVADGARARIRVAGLAARCDFVAGDFCRAVPDGADVYLLKSILHNWDDDRCALILGHCRRALAAGGRVVLVERVMPEQLEGTRSEQSVMRSDLNMLVGLEGCERTAAEFTALLDCASFAAPRFTPTATDFTIIECTAR